MAAVMKFADPDVNFALTSLLVSAPPGFPTNNLPEISVQSLAVEIVPNQGNAKNDMLCMANSKRSRCSKMVSVWVKFQSFLRRGDNLLIYCDRKQVVNRRVTGKIIRNLGQNSVSQCT